MQSFCAERFVFVGLIIAFAIILVSGCSQPVFVGFPTPTPDEIVLTPNEGAPVPPFVSSA